MMHIRGKYLFFKNGDIRINNPAQMGTFLLENEFSYIITSDGEIVGVDAEKCTINPDGIHPLDCPPFVLIEKARWLSPVTNPPLTVFYCYNRSLFLDLSLKSFAASVGDDLQNQKIVIILNGANEHPLTKQVALDFKASHVMKEGFIDVYETEFNAGFTAVNIAIQIYPNEKNILR
jgi:hypothetical protein